MQMKRYFLFVSNVIAEQIYEVIDVWDKPNYAQFWELFNEHLDPFYSKQRGRVLRLHGAPGTGKSTLVKHWLARVSQQFEDSVTIYFDFWTLFPSHQVLRSFVRSMSACGFAFETFREWEQTLRKSPPEY
jgi:hypothetical protein